MYKKTFIIHDMYGGYKVRLYSSSPVWSRRGQKNLPSPLFTTLINWEFFALIEAAHRGDGCRKLPSLGGGGSFIDSCVTKGSNVSFITCLNNGKAQKTYLNKIHTSPLCISIIIAYICSMQSRHPTNLGSIC